MHSLCGIIGSCRTLLNLTIYLPQEASAWTQSLCSSLHELKLLHTLTKDLVRTREGKRGAGAREGMDVGWRAQKSFSMWSVSQVSICHLAQVEDELLLTRNGQIIVHETSRHVEVTSYSPSLRHLLRLVHNASSDATPLSPYGSNSNRSQVSLPSFQHYRIVC